MKKPATLALLFFAFSGLSAFAQSPADSSRPIFLRPSFKKVFIVVLENGNAKAAMKQKHLKEFAGRGAFLSQFMAITHPSQPNYIAMTSGNTWGVTDDKNVTLDVRSIADLLEEKGLTWKVYAENYPGNCYLGSQRWFIYARKHVPFLSYKNIQSDPDRCKNIVNASELDKDIKSGKLPTYSFYVPNQWNQGHFPSNLGEADEFVAKRLLPLASNPAFMKDQLVVLTFDENDKSDPNRVFTVLYGNSVIAGQTSTDPYTHYSMLRTIEETFGLGTLGQGDASADPIAGIWK